MDYKEYSRLRSIARKRIERASAAGAMEYVRIPTVAEVRASANPDEYMRTVKQFLNTPKATLRESKREAISMPKVEFAPVPPVTNKLTPEQKKIRRREQSRRSKAKRAVERAASSAKEAKNKVGFLKALETVAKDWREQGVDIGNWLGILSPAKAKAFTDYMEYRFSQGDYKNRYTIDTFIRDFGELVRAGYNVQDIQGDFDVFLENQKRLKQNKRKANKYGVDTDEVDSAWRRFVKEKVKDAAKDIAKDVVKAAVKAIF